MSSGIMMLSKYSKALLISALIGMILPLLVANLVVSRTIAASVEASKWIIHSAEVFANLDEMNTLLKDAESWQRGYLTTGHAYYLNHYTETVRNIEFTLNTLRIWWAGSENQQANFKSLETLVSLELEELMSMINARKEHSTEQLVLTDKGMSIMNNIRLLLSKMKEEETRFLLNSNSDSVQVSNDAVRHMVYGSALSTILALFTFLVLYKTINSQEKKIEELGMNGLRFGALYGMSRMTDASLEELMKGAAQQMAILTSSEIATLLLISEDQGYCRKVGWSGNESSGTSSGNPIVLSIENGSFWDQCIEERTPLIINDCASPHPFNLSCPEGHTPIRRLLCTPVLHEDRIVALALVANREGNYSQAHAKQLGLFIEEAWKMLAGKTADSILIQNIK